MRTAIFGGTFDPVHVEHKRLAAAAIKELKLDRIIIMPTFITPNKSGLSASAENRLEMLKIAFNDVAEAEISDYEILKGGTSYTYITVEHFRKIFPDDKLFFIVGGDMLKDFRTWKFPERILAAADLAVFGREADDADYIAEEKYFSDNYGKKFKKLSLVGKPVSSTEVRVYLSLGLRHEGIMPEVYGYITEHGVYPLYEHAGFLKANLTESRLIHTANVAACALKKAKELSLDKSEVLTAALLHDCAKYLKPENYPSFKLPENVPAPVVHQFLGAYVAENVLGVKNPAVLDAIKYHTSGKADMSLLGKLIFVADMVEKGRTYDGVVKLRKLYESDFDKCFKTCIEDEIQHLKNKGLTVFSETLAAYDYYVKGKKE